MRHDDPMEFVNALSEELDRRDKDVAVEIDRRRTLKRLNLLLKVVNVCAIIASVALVAALYVLYKQIHAC